MSVTAPAESAVDNTGSRGTRILGGIIAVGTPLLLLLAFIWSPEDDVMGDAVRLLYVHVPIAIITYVAFSLTAAGSVAYLWKGSWLSKTQFPGDLKTSLSAKIYATEQAVKRLQARALDRLRRETRTGRSPDARRRRFPR